MVMEEEKVNEYEDWPNREDPWDRLNAYWLFKNGVPQIDEVLVVKKRPAAEIKKLKDKFEAREMTDMLKDFFSGRRGLKRSRSFLNFI